MTENINVRINVNNWRVFAFCLIIIQSIGIRFFQGQGIVFSILITAISLKSLSELVLEDYQFLSASFIFLLICKLFNPAFIFSNLIYQASLIFSIYLFLVQYRRQSHLMQWEFFISLRFFAFHAFIGYLLFLIVPGQFAPYGVMNNSLFHIFYVSPTEFMSFHRNTGLFWEPGVLQLAMNLYLFYCIKFKCNIFYIIVGGLTVFSTFSTMGFIILVLNFSYFFYLKFAEERLSIFTILLVLILLLFFVPFLTKNTNEKIDGENTSGLVRMRDLIVSIELIKERPILGHGKFDDNYLLTKNYVINIENELFSNEYIEASGEMGGGFTNGLLGLIAWYGIPISLFLYILYFKNRFIDGNLIERIIYCLIPLLSMISEPIAYTSFFLMFPFSYWILKTNCRPKEVITKRS